jgi:aminoglycoside phosphotransferase family enzyme
MPYQSQNEIVQAMLRPKTYEEDPGEVEMIQTHISYVFLTKDLVFKVKKAVNFGFLDFSTLEKRRLNCLKELNLNKRLCEDMYLEVVPINKANEIHIRGEGETIEYALKMKKIPQERIMTKLLEKGKVRNETIAEIAKIIANFHANAETNQEITKFGSISTIETNWNENFEQTKEFVDVTIQKNQFELIYEKIEEFIRKNTALFKNRMKEGRIRDCHGDIHSGNIFVTTHKIYIFDAIEFNDRFRYSDVVADVAFLAMDLEFKGRKDLSDFLIRKYVENSHDEELFQLLTFYKCYRAYVRGKVVGFKLNDFNVGELEKKICISEAKSYFDLAVNYASKL